MLSILLRESSGLLVGLLWLSTQMEAQVTPTQVVDSAFAALTRRDWPRLASLIHPTALDDLRQETLGLIILVTEERKAGREGGGYNPRDVVIADHLPQNGSENFPQFPGRPTISELASLSSGQFFVRWCAAVYRSDSDGDLVSEVLGLQRRMIGEVREEDTLAHVLYRRESRHVEMGQLFIDLPGRVMVMPLKRVQDGWKLLLNDDLGWSVDFMQILHTHPIWSAHRLKRTTRIAPQATQLPTTPGQPGPAETVRKAFAAFQSRDWRGLATFVDSERLAAFQREELGYLVAWFNSKTARAQATREGISVFMLSYEDSLPPEAMVAQVAAEKVSIFSGAPTLGELAHLSPVDFFVRWCQAVYEVDPEKGPGGGKTELRREVIGEVLESPVLAHVLYRSDGRYKQPWPIGRMPLKRSASGWRLLLNDDIGWSIDLSMLLNQS